MQIQNIDFPFRQDYIRLSKMTNKPDKIYKFMPVMTIISLSNTTITKEFHVKLDHTKCQKKYT